MSYPISVKTIHQINNKNQYLQHCKPRTHDGIIPTIAVGHIPGLTESKESSQCDNVWGNCFGDTMESDPVKQIASHVVYQRPVFDCFIQVLNVYFLEGGRNNPSHPLVVRTMTMPLPFVVLVPGGSINMVLLSTQTKY